MFIYFSRPLALAGFILNLTSWYEIPQGKSGIFMPLVQNLQ